LFDVNLEIGDRILRWSDGVRSMVEDDENLHIVRRCDSPKAAAQRLVTEANKNGGKDNISVVIAEF
jgi:protein phosphatase